MSDRSETFGEVCYFCSPDAPDEAVFLSWTLIIPEGNLSSLDGIIHSYYRDFLCF